MRPPKIPWHERSDTATTVVVVILTGFFGLMSLGYFATGIFLIGKTGWTQVILLCLVFWAAAGILMYTARSFWKRYPNALRWGFASLAIVIAIWMKWPIPSGFYSTVVAAGGLVWLVY